MAVVVADQSQVWSCTRCRAIYRREFPFCPADGGAVVAAENDPLINTEIGPYVIESLLGEGAMGRVYRAHHKHLANRVYAIKVLLGDLAATQEMRMRFLNEARSASKLEHPNVVTVYDVGRTPEGLLYLTMELVDGRSLGDLIEEGPMEASRVVHLARGICDGLAHAHAHGIVHRDLKPENVIVVRGPHGDEVPRIVDFGIAVSIDREDARLTATGMSMGTPGYIAPEQVSGLRVDAAADQYALGVSMFEMLTGGALPFVGSAMEVAAAKTARDAPLVSERMPPGVEVPPALERMVTTMLARKPQERYESIVGVGRMLARWAKAPETEVVPVAPKSPRRFVLAGVVALAAAATIAFVALRSSEPEQAEKLASAPQPPAPETSASPVAHVDDVVVDASVAQKPKAGTPTRKRRPASTRKPQDKRSAARPVITRAADPEPVPEPEPVRVVQPAPAPPPPAPVVPTVFTGRLQRITVSGALSETDVRRALQRVESSLRKCTTSAAGTATVRFTIGDTRRPRNLRGAGVVDAALACLTAAIGATRLEVAPDVGDAEVSVLIQFAGSS